MFSFSYYHRMFREQFTRSTLYAWIHTSSAQQNILHCSAFWVVIELHRTVLHNTQTPFWDGIEFSEVGFAECYCDPDVEHSFLHYLWGGPTAPVLSCTKWSAMYVALHEHDAKKLEGRTPLRFVGCWDCHSGQRTYGGSQWVPAAGDDSEESEGGWFHV